MSWQEEEERRQIDGHERIAVRKQGCSYCIHFNGCHTAVWRGGNTCDLFNAK